MLCGVCRLTIDTGLGCDEPNDEAAIDDRGTGALDMRELQRRSASLLRLWMSNLTSRSDDLAPTPSMLVAGVMSLGVWGSEEPLPLPLEDDDEFRWSRRVEEKEGRRGRSVAEKVAAPTAGEDGFEYVRCPRVGLSRVEVGIVAEAGGALKVENDSVDIDLRCVDRLEIDSSDPTSALLVGPADTVAVGRIFDDETCDTDDEALKSDSVARTSTSRLPVFCNGAPPMSVGRDWPNALEVRMWLNRARGTSASSSSLLPLAHARRAGGFPGFAGDDEGAGNGELIGLGTVVFDADED